MNKIVNLTLLIYNRLIIYLKNNYNNHLKILMICFCLNYPGTLNLNKPCQCTHLLYEHPQHSSVQLQSPHWQVWAKDFPPLAQIPFLLKYPTDLLFNIPYMQMFCRRLNKNTRELCRQSFLHHINKYQSYQPMKLKSLVSNYDFQLKLRDIQKNIRRLLCTIS